MIEAGNFDLDGTLIQAEKLKATSYAHAAVELFRVRSMKTKLSMLSEMWSDSRDVRWQKLWLISSTSLFGHRTQ